MVLNMTESLPETKDMMQHRIQSLLYVIEYACSGSSFDIILCCLDMLILDRYTFPGFVIDDLTGDEIRFSIEDFSLLGPFAHRENTKMFSFLAKIASIEYAEKFRKFIAALDYAISLGE